MAEKNNDDDDDFEGDDDFEDLDFIESKLNAADNFSARRRLEQLREERELERILNSSSYDDFY